MSRPVDLIPAFLRAWAVRPQPKKKRNRDDSNPEIELILVVDTETTVDPTQRLLFGSARLYTVDRDTGLSLEDEWLFYGDDLPGRNPEQMQTLQAYADADSIRLHSQSQFNEEVIWKAAYKGRATVVGFNLPFDFARLAHGWGSARGEPGFSFRLWGKWKDGVWDDYPWRPRLIVRKLAPGRTLFKFRRPKEIDREDQIPEGKTRPDPRYTFHGHFLDLHTLGFALANRRMSLAQACEAFGVEVGKGTTEQHGVITDEYIDYNRRDVEATAGLFAKLYREYRRHPIVLQPTRAFSPATVGKAYLKAMGIRPPLEKWARFPAELLGRVMTGYFGGRAECRIRHVPVPVVTVDFLSMYTTVCSLLRIWRHLTASRMEVEDVTESVQALADRVFAEGPEVMLEPESWRQLVGFARLQPDGDVLPVRANFGSRSDDRPQIGINPYWTDEAVWYPIADVVSAALLGDKAPRIVEAIALQPKGTQAGLKPLSFRNEIPIDPAREDFFRLIIEERKRSQIRDIPSEEKQWLNTGLKTVANATAYGISAEMIRLDGQSDTVSVYGLGDPFDIQVQHPEKPGEFCFPPFAAAITGGARLMLALLERLITNRGGVYANCDTDSMAIVATENGGLIPCPGGSRTLPNGTPAIQALTWAQVDDIIEAFEALHPYDREAVTGSVLEIEDQNYDPATKERRQLWCLATSAKRYVLWSQAKSDIDIRKASEHGLGHLLDPTGDGQRAFAEAAWRIVLADHLDLPKPEPDWLDRPAVARLTITTPYLASIFHPYNQGRDYPDQIKPFGFMLSVSPQRIAGLLTGANRLHLVAPFETDPTRWYSMDWTDIYSGSTYRITGTIDPMKPPTAMPVNTLRDVIGTWATNPEPKSLAPDGSVCKHDTTGLLGRRPVRTTPELVTFIGKESNHLEEAQAGLMGRSDILNEYSDPERDTWQQLMLPTISRLGPAHVASAARVNRRTVERLVQGTPPRPETKLRVTEAVRRLVDVEAGLGLDQALAANLDVTGESRCLECGASLVGRRRDTQYCNNTCRMRNRRRATSQKTSKSRAPTADN